ncbi:MAG: 5-formyltetrahydrofolate cyclo-ligase [Alphaproteobacteria bacterium]|nr:5-formyltetrahydrofolate cyclo-ligase [Alphaproteobacteria bacterium]
MDSLKTEKQWLRGEARAHRVRLAAAAPANAGELAAEHFLAAFAPGRGHVVSVYWPLPEEFDTRPLLVRLQAAGCVVALPVVVGRGQPLVFRRWQPGETLAEGPLGLREPLPRAAQVVPQLVVAPLLACDGQGYRLGYGGGYYDRSLRALRASARTSAVGYAFAGQRVERLPHGPNDEPLDALAHEKGVEHFARIRQG